MDCSAYQGAVPAEVFRRLRQEHGVVELVPQIWGAGPYGTGPNRFLAAQVRNALAAGLAVRRAYVWPPVLAGPAVDYWLKYLPDVTLEALVLDVELDVTLRLQELDTVSAAGLRPEIYTSKYFWGRARIAVLPSDIYDRGVMLWAAWYPREEWDGTWPQDLRPLFEAGLVPGPWADRPDLVCGWQFAGSVPLAGSTFDLSIFVR